MKAIEINFDGLIGPTFGHASFSLGNLASMKHKGQVANPKLAALQGLKKMKLVLDLGGAQGFLLPQERPSLYHLRQFGFEGTPERILENAAREAPQLLFTACSASSMWAANAATATPSFDTEDGKLHITVANLQSHLHRSLEAEDTERMLQTLFADPSCFKIHPPLPGGGGLGDEGAANHIRFCTHHAEEGIHLFVYGKSLFQPDSGSYFPRRQSFEASQAVARRHRLAAHRTFFAQQSPEAVDNGVFHNDVISTGHRNLFLVHERAFLHADRLLHVLQEAFPLNIVQVTEEMLPLETAVSSYLFNGQMIEDSGGNLIFLVPEECRPLDLSWIPVSEIIYTDVGQSMLSGGGPACLRLRVALNEQEREKADPRFFLTPSLYRSLVDWVEKHYRDTLALDDFKDPLLIQEAYAALDELTALLSLGSYYRFQREC